MDEGNNPELVELTAQIVSAYVSNNTVVAADLPQLILETFGALSRTSSGSPPPIDREEPRPKVSVKKSVMADYLICLEDGKKFKSLKRHLRTHYNMSPDGKIFSGDGGGPNSVARGDNGQWMYLFKSENGKMKSERLVNLAKHDYSLEPNGTFTPDGKWIVFRSNLFGPTHVFAVEVEKAVAKN